MNRLEEQRGARSWHKGLEDGFESGWDYGYFLGRCKMAAQKIPERKGTFRDLKVMYIAQGSPGFRTIDYGISKALSGMFREALIVGQSENIVELASRARPDLVLVLNGIFSIPVEQVDGLRQLGVKTAVWIADDPYFIEETTKIIPHYEHIFTHELNCVPYYRELGCDSVHYLPFAASREVFYPKPVERQLHTELCFIGTAFPNRLAFFEEMTDFLAQRNLFMAGAAWDRMKGYEKLAPHIDLAGIQPEFVINHYNAAKIVINLHRADAEIIDGKRWIQALSINPRTYEIAACGTLQLTDVRGDLSQMYAPGKDVATFASPAELKEKIHYYLTHEDERQEMALNGLKRTLRDHTYPQRLNQMMQAIFG